MKYSFWDDIVIIKNLNDYDLEHVKEVLKHHETIFIVINSIDYYKNIGSTSSFVEFYNLLENFKGKIVTIFNGNIYDHVMGFSSLIFMLGNYRIMMSNTFISFSSFDFPHSFDEKYQKYIDKLSKYQIEKYNNIDVKTALQLGLATNIINSLNEISALDL